MVDLFSDDRLLEIAGGDEAFLSVRLARQLIAARATQEHMRARCVWLQERRKALQRLAATRMVRLRTLRKLRARLSAGPVMPETPSEAVIVAAFTCAGIPDDANDDEYRSDFKGLWSAIRSALMQEQCRGGHTERRAAANGRG